MSWYRQRVTPAEGAARTALRTSDSPRPPRLEASFRVEYASIDDLVVAYTMNLSKGGLFVVTERFLPKGSVVDLRIELPDGGGELSAPCRVVHVSDPTDWGSIGQPAGMGLEFVDPEHALRERIERFIAARSDEGASPPSLRPARRLSVLVVDDDPTYRDLAAGAFTARGDTVRTASNGIEALAFCIQEAPDVVVCDVVLPRMNGWQLLRFLRGRPTLAEVPVVFATARTSEEDRLRGYRLGVDDYVTKPYRPGELLTRVNRVVLRSEQSRSRGTDPSALGGDLEQVALSSMLSFLELERKTGVLTVIGDPGGRVLLRAGRVAQVELDDGGELSWQERLFALLDLRSGRFEFVAQAIPESEDIDVAPTSVLLEHARRSDEGER